MAEENKNNGNLKIVDVTWSQTQGESNPMMDADYFICSGSYLTGNFLKSKMSFLFCRNKEKAEMINNKNLDYILYRFFKFTTLFNTLPLFFK